MKNVILIVDDSPYRLEEMQRCLQLIPQWSNVIFTNAPEAINWLNQHLSECVLISLDHDLGSRIWQDGKLIDPLTGRDVVDFLANQVPVCPIIVHTSNESAAIGMQMLLGEKYWTFVRVIPHRDLVWIETEWFPHVKRFLEPLDLHKLTLNQITSTLNNWSNIDRFALTFNPDLENVSWGACFAVGKHSKILFEKSGNLPESLLELRMSLFYERNRWSARLSEPDDETMIYINAIVEKIITIVSHQKDSGKKEEFIIENTDLLDRVRGVIYGQAIGDALGLGMEGFTKSQVAEIYPHGLTSIREIVHDKYRSAWVKGDWTDDTDMMLCILDSLLDLQEINLYDIAWKFYHWASTTPPGIGHGTYNIIFAKYMLGIDFFQPNFSENYYVAARSYWEADHQNFAGNAGIMRTSILGIWDYEHLEKVKENAAKICQLTHYDPRCVGSSVAVSLTISQLLQGVKDLDILFANIKQEVRDYHPEIEKYLEVSQSPDIANLNLGEPEHMGYTLKTMSAGFWALQHAESYRDGILKIIHEGGDADTNAAVAGAILGAKFGYHSIPVEWINELAYKRELDIRIEQLVYLMKLHSVK